MQKKILFFVLVLFLISCTSLEQKKKTLDNSFIQNDKDVKDNNSKDNQNNNKNNNQNNFVKDVSSVQEKNTIEEEKRFFQDPFFAACENKQITFSAAPLSIEEVAYIFPMGMMIGAHVTPIDHQYYIPVSDGKKHAVYTPAKGIITDIQHMVSFIGNKDEENKVGKVDDYRLVIKHSCNLTTIYIHVGTLSEKIMQEVGSFENNIRVNIPVAAGEIIGFVTKSFDFSAHDTAVTLKGFVIPEHYAAEEWKVHSVDPADYFTQQLRAQVLSKSIRTAFPEGGKIDYDIDGKLVGNWFLENTNGYAGREQSNYWVGHIAFAYDAFDPSFVVVSLGDAEKRAEQFGVLTNTPDPASVDINTGKVSYDLVSYEYKKQDGTLWDRQHYTTNLTAIHGKEQKGVLLVQMIESRKMKAEFFIDKTKEQTHDFTSNAKVYER